MLSCHKKKLRSIFHYCLFIGNKMTYTYLSNHDCLKPYLLFPSFYCLK